MPTTDPSRSTAKKLVLVVDDETPVREVLCALLEDRGFTAFGAANGVEALALMTRHGERLHCVLLDLTLPGSRPAELVGALRALAPGVRLILTSGRPQEELEAAVALLACDGLIRKPFGAAELFTALRTPRVT